MNSSLLLHAGGWSATMAQLLLVPVPPATDTYVPVPYDRLVEEVKVQLPRFGLHVSREEYGLAREGRQMFGVLSCKNGQPDADYCLAIGLRSSYDRSLSVGLVAGTRVFCCDNLAFSGEVQAARKHTVNVLRDLPNLVYGMIVSVYEQRGRIDGEIAAMKARTVPTPEAHHVMVEAVRQRVISASRLPAVLREWDQPRHPEFEPRTAWSLFNAFTEVHKKAPPRVQMGGSLKLSTLFRKVLSLG